MYKRSESVRYDAYVKLMLGGWQPPEHVPLLVEVCLGVPRRNMHRIDVDKWAAVIVDAVLGSRYDQWVYKLVAEKAMTDGDGYAEVAITYTPGKTRASTSTG